MSANLILYDRIWLREYIDRITYQRSLLRSMRSALLREMSSPLEEPQVNYEDILIQIDELDKSLEVTETTLKDYMNNAHNTAIRFQKQCQDIQLPVFIADK